MIARHRFAAAAAAAALAAVAAPAASGEVTYSPAYWQLLSEYADREVQIGDDAWWGPGFPRRGAYAEYHPATPLPTPGEVEDCLYDEWWLLPDGTFVSTGGFPGWVEDALAPQGWSHYWWEGL